MTSHASCNKCAFFDDHHKAQAAGMVGSDGLCRYNPPTTQPGPNEHGLWPVVTASDWCGHFSVTASSQVAAE